MAQIDFTGDSDFKSNQIVVHLIADKLRGLVDTTHSFTYRHYDSEIMKFVLPLTI